MLSHARMYIDGQWAESGETFDALAPESGKAFGRVERAQAEHIDLAVSAARKALDGWRRTPVAERARIVEAAADNLVQRYGEAGQATPLKELISKEVGKRLPEADIEVIESSDMLRYFAATAPRLLTEQALELNRELWPHKESKILFEPVGVIAVIKAWNYPLEIPLWTIGAALVTGNTAVFKPSEHSTLVGCEIVNIFAEAGLPPGVLNMVTGDGAVGQALAGHKGIDMVAFTGSVRAGREIATTCGQLLRRYSLELGGNDAAVVLSDADLELTANGLVWGAFCNSGQVCVGVKRAYVHESVAEGLTAAILERTKSLRLGVDYGPLITSRQLDDVHRFVADATSVGAKLLIGGAPAESDSGGFFYLPTVLTDVPANALLMTEECFGPVLPIVPVKDDEAAIMLANQSEYGLGGSVWTGDLDKGRKVARRLEAGMVWVNDVNVAFPEAPWGGIRNSGPGIDLSEWGILEYTTKKHLSVDVSADKRRDWWYPY